MDIANRLEKMQVHPSSTSSGDAASTSRSLGRAGGQAMRKQRSQRFTVSTNSSSSGTATPPPLPSTRPAIPALPYQPAPPPVQSQTLSTDPFSHHPRYEPSIDTASSGNPNSISTNAAAANYYSNTATYSTSGNSYSSAKAASRGGLPTEWMQQQQQPPPPSSQLSSGYAALLGRPAAAQMDDDVIPTAIVIKNIAFAVPKEVLLGVMEDLHLPPPFAFNYHYDNAQFRGLAFANFRTAQEAALTVTALNGFELHGRKLRTEFKKVLKEGEKERIERDKAIKRMRSQQHLHAETPGPPVGTWNRREASAPGGYGFSAGEEDDYGRPYGTSYGRREYVPAPPLPDAYRSMRERELSSYSTSPPSDVGTSISARIVKSDSNSGSESGSRAGELDMNDPQALEIYSRVLLFKDDSFRDQLAFARSLSVSQRRTVHLVAKKLGMEHRSVGEGEDRHVVVFKAGAAPTEPQSIRHRASTLGRQHSYEHQRTPSQDDSLRSKKSLPDVRSHYTASAPSPFHRRSNANLRDARPGVQGLFQQFDMPPMPSASSTMFYQSPLPPSPGGAGAGEGAARRNNGGSGTASAASSPSIDAPKTPPESAFGMAVRQPKGPEEDRGFAAQKLNGRADD